jgi:hypothetical protein
MVQYSSMKTRFAGLFCFVGSLCLIGTHLVGGIIIKQDKNGRLVFTNTIDTRELRLAPNRSSGGIVVSLPLREKIKTLCEKHQFREDLVLAVIKAESSFNPSAVSPKGAVGMMQLMRDTARLYGVSNRFNIDQNLEGGIQHLKFLYGKYRQDIPLTLAAYNAGEEAVERNNGVPPYTETRQYIRRIMTGMGLNFSSFSSRSHTQIFKYTSPEGRVILTDSPPSRTHGRVEVIN